MMKRSGVRSRERARIVRSMMRGCVVYGEVKREQGLQGQ